MTRAEWIIHYRAIRASRVRVSFDLVAAMKEIYGCVLTPYGNAFCRLVDRYRSKLSRSHFDRYDALKEEGKARAKELMRTLVYGKNPFLALLPKRESFDGHSFPIPAYWGEE